MNNTFRIVCLHLSFGRHLAVLIVPPRHVKQPEHGLSIVPGYSKAVRYSLNQCSPGS